jgi:hypothetical protein
MVAAQQAAVKVRGQTHSESSVRNGFGTIVVFVPFMPGCECQLNGRGGNRVEDGGQFIPRRPNTPSLTTRLQHPPTVFGSHKKAPGGLN